MNQNKRNIEFFFQEKLAQFKFRLSQVSLKKKRLFLLKYKIEILRQSNIFNLHKVLRQQ